MKPIHILLLASIQVSALAALQPLKPATEARINIDCFSAQNSSRWQVELPATGFNKPFNLTSDSICINTSQITPAFSTVRILLPGDAAANGANWARARTDHVSFECRATADASLTFHLLVRGKTAGTFQAPFSVAAGTSWQRVTLPIQSFSKLQSFSQIAGIGIRRGATDAGNAIVEIRDICVFAMPFTDANHLRRHAQTIPLTDGWSFAPDPEDTGLAKGWNKKDFDSATWDTINAGQPWQTQGYPNLFGWGWYRKTLVIGEDRRGQPLQLNLGKIASDDDVWFNGVHIGGFWGEYKYENFMQRCYDVPANLIRYGEPNVIAVRVWGGNITFIGNKSGLASGVFSAVIDPYTPLMGSRKAGIAPVPQGLFDLTDAQRSLPLEITFPLPAEIAQAGATVLEVEIADALGAPLSKASASLSDKGATISVSESTARQMYLRGRFAATLTAKKTDGTPVYSGVRTFDRISLTKRDCAPLPTLPQRTDDTPYGKLRLVDEIDCAADPATIPHPYMQGGFDGKANKFTPGPSVETYTQSILGRKARLSKYGWFAYRIGRGKIKPHTTYLLRIEYPEDKPRFCPVEIQTGQTYMDVGWKNGVGKDDVYDNWPLSNTWQWYDVIVPVDHKTTGTGGTGAASIDCGFWVYFMNKNKPNAYYSMWDDGPAIGRIRLYEIDPVANAPVINKPQGLPTRALAVDWERQCDQDPFDVAAYAKLMGYSTVSPIMLKWHTANYTAPMNGYETIRIDAHDFWAHLPQNTAGGAEVLAARPTQHERYLEATRKYGLDYLPRIEYGGSDTLPDEAKAIALDGSLTKPNRFHSWCANLLHPAVVADLKAYLSHLLLPYATDNPQLKGIHWRIRCNRMPISYGKSDLEAFSKETGIPLPHGSDRQWAAWAAGEGRAQYDAWWHSRRAAFHKALVEHVQSIRSDMRILYFNWDPDKISLIEPDITAWGFVKNVVQPVEKGGGRAAYEKERALRKTFTAADYIHVLHTGDFGNAYYGLNRPDLGIRPELYRDIPGFGILGTANYLCYATLPEYLNYFQTADGVEISNPVSYDEVGSRTINPKYEGNMITPAGPDFSMALELLSWFHADARTLTYTVYTFGRGFADAHRRFAQAYLALPAIECEEIPQSNPDLKVRLYKTDKATYIGIGYKGYTQTRVRVKLPNIKTTTIKNLVEGQSDPSIRRLSDGSIEATLDARPMSLHALVAK